MTVYDRWHKSRPRPGEPVCAEHGKAPTAQHGRGDRWQVRLRDDDHKQRARRFPRKADADAYDAKTRAELNAGTYIDPRRAAVAFQVYAEDWRKTRTHDVVTAARIERELRLHVYPAIGKRSMRELGSRPSLTQAWIAGIKLAPGSARQVIRDVSAVFIAAADDGLIVRNPLAARSVTRPKAPESKAQPWTLAQVAEMASALPARFAVIPWLGSGTGMRQGEMFGLALDDIDFLRRVVHVRRQVRLVGDVRCFAPVKNDKTHDVPLSDSLAPILAEHIRQFPPVPVTLPWKVPDGKPVTCSLLLTSKGLALSRTRFNESHWWPAQEKAGLVPARVKGVRRAPARQLGTHALRHTAASAWLAAGVDIVSVAAWLGDTEHTVLATYAHLMPGADARGRKAMDRFFTEAGRPDSAPSVHSGGGL